MVHLRVVPDDRRERTRAAKRARILEATGAVIDRAGLGGVTMQAVADELDCAVGTLYTAFDSKAALLAALQGEAVATLEASYRTARAGWDEALAEAGLEPVTEALVGLLVYGAFVAAAAVVFPDETLLARALLGDAAAGTALPSPAEAQALLPVVHRYLDPPVSRLSEAAGVGAVRPSDPVRRAITWLAALHGVLRLERLSPLDRLLFRPVPLARSLSADLLVGWGADPDEVEVAADEVERLAALGPLAPPPEVGL